MNSGHKEEYKVNQTLMYLFYTSMLKGREGRV